MPATRSSLCRKRTRDESSGRCNDCSHIKVIADLKHEILELNKLLDSERERLAETLSERAASSAVRVKGEGVRVDGGGQGRDAVMVIDTKGVTRPLSDGCRHLLYELELCKKDLEDTRETLQEACEEREALRVKLSESQQTNGNSAELNETAGSTQPPHKTKDSHPHLAWVGSHYLAVSLPEDRMFKPGQSVTPAGVLQKLFEMRVGDKQSQAFSLLLENINIMLSQLEPEWYAKHFAFSRAYVHGNKYKATDRVDTEDFAWLLFEYGAHTPLIEVLAGLQNVLNSTGKGGVTTSALYTSKNMYSSYVMLFRETVSRAYERFALVRERAQRVRSANGLVRVPLTAGLAVGQSESQQGGSNSVKSRVLRSVLEGIEAPPAHISSTQASVEVDRVSHDDPLQLGQSIEELMTRRGLGGRGKERTSSVHRRDRDNFLFRAETSSVVPGQPLQKRVLFDSPWSDDLSAV